MRRTHAHHETPTLPLARTPHTRSALPEGVCCAVCGLTDATWLRVARYGTERAVLCPDSECRQRWEASRPALLLETVAILAAHSKRETARRRA